MTPPPIDLRPYLDELERFDDGLMTPAEQEAFELRLEQDADLQRAYELYEQITSDLRWVAGHETLRHRLQGLDMRLDQRQDALDRMHRRQRRQQRRWGLVAAAVVLAALGLWLALRTPPPNAQRDWARYYVPDPGLPESAGLSSHRPLLAEAMQQYRAGHFPAALHALRRVPTDNLGQDTVLYYNGIILLRQNQPVAARSYLKRVSQMPQSNLTSKARYHLGMAYWMANQATEARAALREVASDSLNPYRKPARRVLDAKVIQPQDSSR
ncbi:Tetratricopeptide repeat-containing protein [Hymenobacter daecheongensis DSM 21074]|uniref:Tetratricopeptide repeat-containing protein n=1 Tax=Hymenobacter daecheongensis DSM 21074 TaxID=1121955 RepID=A0A1M6B1J5_9BACT|nr:tetratricopeptide repeat protein [Hymenobacter daecheongensis]SHI42363.1 Tetratricopeptide repeat-containing protein [Hymenobacter daecheongensis DSM 21074]